MNAKEIVAEKKIICGYWAHLGGEKPIMLGTPERKQLSWGRHCKYCKTALTHRSVLSVLSALSALSVLSVLSVLSRKLGGLFMWIRWEGQNTQPSVKTASMQGSYRAARESKKERIFHMLNWG